jgi:hypothetical protein
LKFILLSVKFLQLSFNSVPFKHLSSKMVDCKVSVWVISGNKFVGEEVDILIWPGEGLLVGVIGEGCSGGFVGVIGVGCSGWVVGVIGEGCSG